MAAALANRDESILFENPANFRARKDSKLPNRYLDLSDKNVAVEPARNLGRVRRLEEQGKRLDKVRPGFLDRRSLTRDIELGTKRHKPIVFPLDNRSQT